MPYIERHGRWEVTTARAVATLEVAASTQANEAAAEDREADGSATDDLVGEPA